MAGTIGDAIPPAVTQHVSSRLPCSSLAPNASGKRAKEIMTSRQVLGPSTGGRVGGVQLPAVATRRRGGSGIRSLSRKRATHSCIGWWTGPATAMPRHVLHERTPNGRRRKSHAACPGGSVQGAGVRSPLHFRMRRCQPGLQPVRCGTGGRRLRHRRNLSRLIGAGRPRPRRWTGRHSVCLARRLVHNRRQV
eukprot:98566-Chlamydomonas_euryale.AAC.8